MNKLEELSKIGEQIQSMAGSEKIEHECYIFLASVKCPGGAPHHHGIGVVGGDKTALPDVIFGVAEKDPVFAKAVRKAAKMLKATKHDGNPILDLLKQASHVIQPEN